MCIFINLQLKLEYSSVMIHSPSCCSFFKYLYHSIPQKKAEAPKCSLVMCLPITKAVRKDGHVFPPLRLFVAQMHLETQSYQGWSGVWCVDSRSSLNSQYPSERVQGSRQSSFSSLPSYFCLHPSAHKPFNRIKERCHRWHSRKEITRLLLKTPLKHLTSADLAKEVCSTRRNLLATAYFWFRISLIAR